MTPFRIAWDANRSAGRRRRRHYHRLKAHQIACELRRDAARRECKHRARMYDRMGATA